MEDDQVNDEVTEESEDQSSEEQSEETTEDNSKDDMSDTIKGLQKGYTTTRQDLAEIKNSFSTKIDELTQAIKQSNQQPENEDEYVTAGRLKSILNETQQAQTKAIEAKKQEAENHIKQVTDDLCDSGIIKNEADKKEFMAYAVKNQDTNLYRAAANWNAERKTVDVKKAAKKEAHKKEGSRVGDTSKTATKEQGIDIAKVRNMDWSDF